MIPKNESKRDKFVRIATARTNKILEMIQLLGNCSNKSTYEFTDKDVDKIFSAIENELKEAKRKFTVADSKKSSSFSLE